MAMHKYVNITALSLDLFGIGGLYFDFWLILQFSMPILYGS